MRRRSSAARPASSRPTSRSARVNALFIAWPPAGHVALRGFLRGRYRSVSVPSNASAAIATVSESVGCGWIVSPMSAASAPISIASPTSAIRSPAFVPTIPPPMTRCDSRVEQQLRESLVAPDRERAPARGPGEHRLFEGHAARPGVRLGEPDPGDLRIRVGDRRNDARVEVALESGGGFRGDLAFVRRLVSEHRLPDDVADREDVRHVRPHLPVDRDETSLVHLDARRLGADAPAVRSATHRNEHLAVDLRPGRLVPGERHTQAIVESARPP